MMCVYVGVLGAPDGFHSGVNGVETEFLIASFHQQSLCVSFLLNMTEKWFQSSDECFEDGHIPTHNYSMCCCSNNALIGICCMCWTDC